jgi:DNA-directed RNA polymerase subunit RPC12/RpoP
MVLVMAVWVIANPPSAPRLPPSTPQALPPARPVTRTIVETKNTCKACGKVWFYRKRDLQEQRAARMQNVSKGLMMCGGCLPAVFIPQQKVLDLTRCPECGSRAVLSQEVIHEV